MPARRTSSSRSAQPRAGEVVALLEQRIVEAPRALELPGPELLRRERRHQRDQIGPEMRGRARRGEVRKRFEAERRRLEPRERPARGAGTDPGQQLQETEGRDAVARVLGPAQDREQVLDVRELEELEPAELDVGDVAAAQLDLELAAVVGGAEQHRLLAQLQAGLAVGQHRAHDVVDLGRSRRRPSPDGASAPSAARRTGSWCSLPPRGR